MQNAVQMVNLTFSYLGGLMALMVALAIPGFLCWLGAGPLAKRICKIMTERNEPAIDHLHGVNFDVCRRANSMLMRGDDTGGAADSTDGSESKTLEQPEIY